MSATTLHAKLRAGALLGAFLASLALSGLLAASALAGEGAPEPEANPASAQVNAELAVCPGQTFAQPFEALGDANYYTLVEGSRFNRAGEGWQLLGNARIVESTRPDGSRGGVLDLPAGSIAISPPVCVTLQYPTARTWVESVEGNGSLTMAVAYNVTLGHPGAGLPEVSLGSISARSGRGWELSRAFNVNPQLGGHEEGVREARFVYVANGRGEDFRVSGLYVDPRFSN